MTTALSSQEQLCIDGATATSMMVYKLIDFTAIFPITPSSVMAETIEQYAAQGRKNIFGNVVTVRQAWSELGAIGTCHGAATAGALTATFSSSQGVLLMISNLYHMAGERIPFVLHVATRTVGMAATSLATDHTDVYAIEGTNMCALSSCNVQECYDMALISHTTATNVQAAFCHFFEGYRVSHQFETIQVFKDDADIKDFLCEDRLAKWRSENAMDTDRPIASNIGLGGEIHMQIVESQGAVFDSIPYRIEEAFDLLYQKTGRRYHCFEYFGHPTPDVVVVVMGATSLTFENVVDALVKRENRRIGFVRVRLFRPFSIELFSNAIPKSAKVVVALDRAPELLNAGGTLYRETLASLMKTGRLGTGHNSVRLVAGGRYSYYGWELGPADVVALYETFNISTRHIEKMPTDFVLSIKDDIRKRSLRPALPESIPKGLLPEGTTECILWGLGSDGTIGACRNAMKILSDRVGCECQANFEFDGKKSSGTTVSHLRFGPKKIRAQYNIEEAGYVACHAQSYVSKFNVLHGIKENGFFVLNTEHDIVETLEKYLPAEMKREIARKNIQVYAVNANKVAQSVGLGGRINTIMILFFLKLGLSKLLDFDIACEDMKAAAKITYAKQKAEVIEANVKAIDVARSVIEQCRIEYDRARWINADPSESTANQVYGPEPDKYVKDIILPSVTRKFANISTKDVMKYNSGKIPGGYSKYEKLGSAAKVPTWKKENCIQCGFCSVQCPHAAVRCFVMNEDNKPDNVPEDFEMLDMKGKLAAVNSDSSKIKFRVQVSPLDCRGCGVCVEACPKDALAMTPIDTVLDKQQKLFDWAYDSLQFTQGTTNIDTESCNLRDLQLRFPYMEFPGSCPGCGESNTMKMLATLYGDSMVASIGVGCSLVWMHFGYMRPFNLDSDSRGIAACSSLFEDNSVFGWGVALDRDAKRANLREYLQANVEKITDESLKTTVQGWLDTFDDRKASIRTSRELRGTIGIERLDKGDHKNNPEYIIPTVDNLASKFQQSGVDLDVAKHILLNNNYLIKASHWLVGGDGWAYDIDFAGFDHIVASRDRVRVLVLVNHCFGNTGGQKSKATSIGSVMKNAYAGVNVKDKKMGVMLMSTYRDVYVGQISLGYNRNQALQVFREAEHFDGPAVVLAYCPCISHMVQGGLTHQERQQKLAVETGVWPVFRYNPSKPIGDRMKLEYKGPIKPVKDFMNTEQRFGALAKRDPARFEEMAAALQSDVEEHWKVLQGLKAIDVPTDPIVFG
nr:pyruvate synthase [Giardia intestinalis]